MLNISKFISTHVTKRDTSMFAWDIQNNFEELSHSIKNKTVLVIGGAGTIGSSYIRALVKFKPKSLVVVDINENGLTELTRDLRSTEELFVPEEYITYPMNYADPVFYKMFKERKGFDIVANFSAHKHVRSEKDRFSVEALINNNIINAKALLDILEQYPPQRFFCVSTDKAANPVNIMGGSKKIMEDMIMTFSQKYPVTTARFANVAFSNGSLPAGFLERISKGQPISAPKDVTRYFVSPEESGQICLLACILGKSGEIYFPKLKKEQVMTFSDMANKLLNEHGFKVNECNSEQEAIQKSKEITVHYPVYYSDSNTTGEKPYEEFYTAGEEVELDRYKALGVVTNLIPRPMSEINLLLKLLKQAFEDTSTTKADIVKIMKDFLINFDHKEVGKSLDSKM
ncbi:MULTISPECIES: polysaccharide biosynthesis protein [unclassified Polaribacter]|uniref:polysaccharide biosynthesis protein n=1 Tax=unclassified Polaribacter TaxID=196858 RepID=UPI0011BE8EEF|nr:MULTISPECIES: polysaccharide biosynthesis protein [unclassified Polaribacter]TXD49014.1 NAD-dependent epimerase/dehydratase family protein [Polaribacter sp. IC063]TXD57193.1 NAD-dependent epimerase/dehydratase family protein [Polaribacter sp. IC066]